MQSSTEWIGVQERALTTGPETMEHRDLPPNVGEDLIGSATKVEEIIRALAKRGCADLTSSIDLDACSQFPLAGGGFCDVYKGALHDGEGTRIAIKSLRVYDGSEAEGDMEKRRILKRAARELYHWSKLTHPNVLPLMGLAIFRGQLAMVSEWMVNGDLMSFIRLKPDANRNRLCMDVCEGLCYIHMKGMVHGDLKAANVMVSTQGIAMITDFGNTQLRDITLKFSNTNTLGISLRWTAPELLLDDNGPQVSKEADVYAYGMTMLETLTGKVPYDATGDQRLFILVAVDKKLPPRPDIDIGDDLWGLLNSCWAREPSERPRIAIIKDRLQVLFWPPSDARFIEGVGPGYPGHVSALVEPQQMGGEYERYEREGTEMQAREGEKYEMKTRESEGQGEEYEQIQRPEPVPIQRLAPSWQQAGMAPSHASPMSRSLTEPALPASSRAGRPVMQRLMTDYARPLPSDLYRPPPLPQAPQHTTSPPIASRYMEYNSTRALPDTFSRRTSDERVDDIYGGMERPSASPLAVNATMFAPLLYDPEPESVSPSSVEGGPSPHDTGSDRDTTAPVVDQKECEDGPGTLRQLTARKVSNTNTSTNPGSGSGSGGQDASQPPLVRRQSSSRGEVYQKLEPSHPNRDLDRPAIDASNSLSTQSPSVRKPFSPPQHSATRRMIVAATHDTEDYVVADITGCTDAWAIRERILSKLHIPDDLHSSFCIYRTELGGSPIGPALDDAQLLVDCQDFGDDRGSLKFLAQRSDALPKSTDPDMPPAPVVAPVLPPSLPRRIATPLKREILPETSRRH